MSTFYFVDPFDKAGVPTTLNAPFVEGGASTKVDVAPETLGEIFTKVPEGINFATSRPEALLSSCDIAIEAGPESEETTVTIKLSFLDDGAGYQNVLGYYPYKTSSPPLKPSDIPELYILAPRWRGNNRGGVLVAGDSMRVPFETDVTGKGAHNFVWPTGYSIGLFLISNGWRSMGNWDGQTSNNSAVKSLVNLSNPIFFSNSSLNTGNSTGYKHQCMAFESSTNPGQIIMGFEDIRRPGGDQDFNDALFSLTVTPFKLAKSGFIPLNTETDFGYICMEDSTGDDDYNDVVFKYEIGQEHAESSTTEDPKISAVTLTIHSLIRGAWADHRVGVALDDVDAFVKRGGSITRETFIKGSEKSTVDYEVNIGEGGRVVLVDSTKSFINDDGTVGGNTDLSKNLQGVSSVRLKFSFADPPSPSEIPAALKYPFVWWLDVHSDGTAKSSVAESPIVNTFYSNVGFTKADNPVWARNGLGDNIPKILVLPGDMPKFTKEKNGIFNAFPNFLAHLVSKGEKLGDWYKYPEVTGKSAASLSIDVQTRQWTI